MDHHCCQVSHPLKLEIVLTHRSVLDDVTVHRHALLVTLHPVEYLCLELLVLELVGGPPSLQNCQGLGVSILLEKARSGNLLNSIALTFQH